MSHSLEASRPATECLFCHSENLAVWRHNALFFACRDRFPVTPGHTLLIPYRHVPTAFGLTEAEVVALHDLIADIQPLLNAEFHPNGFNIGANAGVAAGQTVMHCHIHLIPRYLGDDPNPVGGVRKVIPAKANYRNKMVD